MDEKDRELQELRRQVESLKAEVVKRDKWIEFKRTYLECRCSICGWEVAEKSDFCPYLRTNLMLERSDYDKILEGLDIQKNNGVILLGPGLEFCGVMPRDAEIEVIRKAAVDDA